MWSQILVLVCVLISLGYITVKSKNKLSAKYLLSFIILVLVFILFLNFRDYDAFNLQAGNHLQIFSLCSVLALELIIIRALRPVHSRFPFLFVFAPYLAYATIPFMFATINLHMLTVAILGGGALIVSYLLIPGLLKRIESTGFLLTGVLLLTITYVFQILQMLYTVSESWITDVPFAFGMVLVSVPISELLKHNNSN